MRRYCDYYEVICSRPESDCLENCPKEQPSQHQPDTDLLAHIQSYSDHPDVYDCKWEDGCGGCPYFDDCKIVN